MNNKEFIAALATELNCDIHTAQKFVNDLTEEIACMADEGNDVTIHGFGTFEVKKYNERIIINPASGKKMLVPPRIAVGFKMSQTLKNKTK